jgi:hypothetical protein
LLDMDGFDSAWLKWAQAVVNADVLQDNINELHNAGQVQIQMGMTQEYDARRHCVIITAGPEVPRVFPVHWGATRRHRSQLQMQSRPPRLVVVQARTYSEPDGTTRAISAVSYRTRSPAVQSLGGVEASESTARRYRERPSLPAVPRTAASDRPTCLRRASGPVKCRQAQGYPTRLLVFLNVSTT